jgi:DNA-binding NtrC family response regulator
MPLNANSTLPAQILLVEDNQGFRTLLQDALTIMGYRVSTVDCGSKALEILTTQPEEHHLLICDFNLWDMTACELLSSLEASGDTERVPVIIMTGDANIHKLCPEHMRQVDALLEKPFPLSQLRRIVERLLLPQAG